MRARSRLTTPLIRRHGKLEPGVLGRGAGPRRGRLRRPGPRHGPRRSFGMFSCSRATNEMNFVAQKFIRSVIGTNNIDSCNRT